MSSGPPKKSDSDIIFEPKKPQVKIPPVVQDMVKALMVRAEARMKASNEALGELLGEPMEVWIHIQNNKVLFSMHGSQAAAPALGRAIVKAVQEYEVEHVEMAPNTFVSGRVGEPAIRYERYVRFDWKQKKLFTNFPQNEGEAFFGALAIVVEELQGTIINHKVGTA